MSAEEVTRLLEELAQRLEGPGRYLFELAVRQVIIEGLLPWVVLLVSLPVAAVLTWLLRPHWVDDWCDHVLATWFAIIWGGAWLVALGSVAVGLLSLPQLLNPEYAALLRIVETIRP